ncbi:MAG: hypothetical protein LBC82_00985 [Oscillospiraceae bacterium]|nr:hypothetical protein [Oscillospiraceae bacterium]
MKNSKKMLTSALVSVALILGVLIGTQILIPSFATDKEESVKKQEIQENAGFPLNENGQTYGSPMDNEFKAYPELVRVLASNGLEGYAYYSDLQSPKPKSPEEAGALMERYRELNEQGIFARTIPVYLSDGKTVIGEFEISIDVGLVEYSKIQ